MNIINKKTAIAVLLAIAFLYAYEAALVDKASGSTSSREAVISFVGDIMLSRDVAMVIDKYGMDYPYSYVAGIFADSDLVVANLECPLTDHDRPVLKDKRILFKAAPDNAMALRDAGIDILSLANNHTMDYQAKGLADTMDALSKSGITVIGASYDSRPAEPYFIEIKGIKLGFLAYTCLPPEGFHHIIGEPSVAYARDGHLEETMSRISEAADQCDFLIVYYHWGDEYTRMITESQRNIARASIDAGAALVVGTHPHVLQEREEYNKGLIYYSLGNFVFDRQNPPNTDKSVILRVSIDETGISDTQEIPVIIYNGQPRPHDP